MLLKIEQNTQDTVKECRFFGSIYIFLPSYTATFPLSIALLKLSFLTVGSSFQLSKLSLMLWGK